LRARLAQQGKAGVALRLLLAAALAGFLLVFAARTLVTSPVPSSPSCSLEPQPLVHYATSNATPQQTAEEIRVALRVLQRRTPCNFLVFGLGLDSPMWAALNHGGRTVFLEEDAAWIGSVRGRHPALESHHVAYDTALADADALLGLRTHPACVAQPDRRGVRRERREPRRVCE
jgi:glucuronoxylan 4-O-methyltransferase